MMTNNSADASAPWPLRATPGASAMSRVSSRPKPLTISLSAPLRSTIAPSGAAETVIACLNPAAMDNTPTSTATTPAMPMTVAATAPRRCGRLIRPNLVMEPICESQLMGPDIKIFQILISQFSILNFTFPELKNENCHIEFPKR